MSIYTNATAFAQRGWRVLPIHTIDPSDGQCSCGKAGCESPGKHPLTANGVHDATLDAEIIKRWCDETNGLANVGIATGNGLLVVDADAGKGGLQSLEQWQQQYGPLPLTPTVGTGGGGKHCYFAMPEGVILGNRAGVAPGIDIRGECGYVVAPPSLHASGNRYQWLVPPDTPLATAPDWLIELLTHQQQPASGLNLELLPDLSNSPGVGEGERNATLCKLVGVHLARGENQERIEPLALAWAERCTPAYPHAEAIKVVQELGRKHERKQPPLAIAPTAADTDAGLDAIPLPLLPLWPTLHADALHGLAGDVVRLLEPETEADPAGILLSLLACVGNCVGRKVWFPVEGDKHYCNLFITLVGQSSRGRKGTSLGRTMGLWDELDAWRKDRMSSGLSSGEGLKYHVRDSVEATEPVKEKGTITGYRQVVKDPGVSDKRLLVVEPELAQALRQMQREGNTLSPVLRQAWDSGNLRTLTKNDPVTATDAHISVLGHITSDELGKLLSDCDTANGFANRFCWALVKRSKLLPDGGREIDLTPQRERLQTAIAGVSGRMERSPEASALWRELYPSLTADRSGRWGMATSRAEAQSLRLSMIYAVLDDSTTIEVEHLRAAYAVWCYCEASAKQIFGEGEALPPLERKLLQAIRQQPGSNRKELHKALGGHTPADVMVTALSVLHGQGLVYPKASSNPNGGRPCERWWPCERTNQSTPGDGNTPCEQTNKPLEGTGKGVSSFVRNGSGVSGCQSDEVSSFARSPADAPANPLDLQELFAQVKALGGKIIRRGEGFGVMAGGEDLLLSPAIKASLDTHADELAVVCGMPKTNANDGQPADPPPEAITEMLEDFRRHDAQLAQRGITRRTKADPDWCRRYLIAQAKRIAEVEIRTGRMEDGFMADHPICHRYLLGEAAKITAVERERRASEKPIAESIDDLDSWFASLNIDAQNFVSELRAGS